MGKNQLFQEARHLVQYAEKVASRLIEGDKEKAIAKAENALSSAYANSSLAEQKQLSELQQTLDRIK
ncbi:DUF3813 domain-containing protein [Bacillus alveayuensis]|jgi:hypothetical protein|uniref:DUF3813 domain-containing protein n=1 Tax=Aeribacillus alveayuensis TaxID=279215 RepID=A0ABT9VN58_9BACI|nr:DUF3813 domain-containing protein [Bacillus alveayuensis]MDQ0162411.1 hypothetical protein [Bacillus alveayuensis]